MPFFGDAADCHLRPFKELALKPNQNNARDLKRKLLKRVRWPDPYYAAVRVWDPKQENLVEKLLPFLLPHEVLAAIAAAADPECLYDQTALDPAAKIHMESAKQQLALDALVPLGLWGDGVPCNWDRSESFEVYAINFPGIAVGKRSRRIRIPITGVSHRFLVNRVTTEDIFSVISWSFRISAAGTWPSKRHDGTAWGKTDGARRRKTGQSLGCSAILLEVRGDWKFFKDVFAFPGWNDSGGCCWRCRATPADIQDSSANAVWRTAGYRLDHWQLMLRLLPKGISKLFSCPCLRSECFKIDWLHCCDLGVCADFLGNCFWYLLQKMPGRSRKAQASQLFLRIREFYVLHNVQERLPCLKVTMLKKEKAKTPKLKASAAEARALVPCAKLLCEMFLDKAKPVEAAILSAARLLVEAYDCLSLETFRHENLAAACRKFVVQYTALQEFHKGTRGNLKLWKLKPKFHLWQELCEYSTAPPILSWTYRDEDFGGSAAAWVHSRGGPQTAKSGPQRLLDNFRAKEKVPNLRD